MEKIKRTTEGYVDLNGCRFGGTIRKAREVYIGDDKYYFKHDSINGFFPRSKVEYVEDSLANSTYIYLNELYISRMAKHFGINSVQYDLAKKGRTLGVLSKDYNADNEATAEIGDLLNVEFYRPRNDLKYVMCNFDNEVVDPKVIGQLQNLSLFDFATLQVDRNDTNVMITRNDSDKYNGVLALDHGYNGIAFEGRRNAKIVGRGVDSAKKFLDAYIDNRFQTTMGITKTHSTTEEYLEDVRTSPFICGKVIDSFLGKLDDFLVNGKMKDIHNELVERYNVAVDTRYEDEMCYAMEAMGEKLDKSYNKRKENNTLEYDVMC